MIFLHEYSQILCELFVNNCKIKQCFNCQRYDHINKNCWHKQRYSICVKWNNNATCKMSINKRKCVNSDNNHSIWLFKWNQINQKEEISDI
jgi:hypothetical protein